MATNPYAYKKSKTFYTPGQKPAFKLSRTKIDLFTDCKRCFYLDRRFGVGRPSGAPFTLNIAVDALLKKEFDVHRTDATTHPLMKTYGIDAVPFQHEKINEWRENFVGVQSKHKKTNFLIFGAVDDVWINKNGELIVVDYKATSKDGEIVLEDTKWHNQYRRQMEVYQWLLRQNKFEVSDTGYFVYVNGKKDREAFDGKLDFDVSILPYTGNDTWIEPTLIAIKELLDQEIIPDASEDCDYCAYRTIAGETLRDHEKNRRNKIAE